MREFTTFLWLFLLLASMLCFWGSHKVPLFDTDEPRYAQAAREMMERNDWILPTFNGQPRYAKPALFYWLLILAYKIFGVNEFAARFWSGVASIFVAFILFFTVKPIFGSEAALLSSLCWLTSLGALIFSHAAITDMVLTAFMAGALMAFWRWANEMQKTWFFAAAIFCALAVLTKGPVGLVLPALIFASSLTFIRLPKFNFSIATIAGGLFIFLAIVLPWYLAVTVRTEGEFLRQFFFVENIQRYTHTTKLPLWLHIIYFPLTVFLLGFPWSSLGVWMFGRLANFSDEQKKWLTFFKVWTLLPLVVFTFSQTKNPQYVLLSVPPLTALSALWFTTEHHYKAMGRAVWLAAAVLSSLVLLMTQTIFNSVPEWRMRLSGDAPINFGWGIFASAFVVFVSGFLIFLPHRLFAFFGIAAMLLLQTIALNNLAPRLGYYRQEPLKHFAQMASTQMGLDDLLIVFRRDLSSAVFYSNRIVKRVDDIRQLSNLLQQNRRVDALLHIKSFSALKQVSGWHLVEKQGAFIWVSNRKVQCPFHR